MFFACLLKPSNYGRNVGGPDNVRVPKGQEPREKRRRVEVAGKKDQAPQPPLELLMSIDEATQRINDRTAKGYELKKMPIKTEGNLDFWKGEYSKWSAYNVEMLRRMFTSREIADEYNALIGFVVQRTIPPFSKRVTDFHSNIDGKIHRLESIRERLELIPLAELKKLSEELANVAVKSTSKVFLVHGHDEAARESVARFLEKITLEPIILHEKPNQGMTVIEKLESNSDVGFAVILLTPDDEGRSKAEGEELRDRARQNVLLELGYFIGLLTRKNVCALHKGSVEIPTDYLGVLFVPYDEAGGWQLRLAKELKAAGFQVDINKIV